MLGTASTPPCSSHSSSGAGEGRSHADVEPTVYRVDLTTGASELWRRVAADLDPDRFVVRQVSYASRDGTPISMFLVHRAGVEPTGDNPCYLTGYGGFNISMTPAFSRSLLLWLEQGGVLAVPNIRGGGEYGESWHQNGMLGKKQNSFDDFIAAAEWLIRESYTTPERLAAAGGSNGGLLMGAVLTQRPELFRAVLIQVPLLDMLRYHHFLIARLWIPEYGSPDDPVQFRWLRDYSPYHRVEHGRPTRRCCWQRRRAIPGSIRCMPAKWRRDCRRPRRLSGRCCSVWKRERDTEQESRWPKCSTS